MNDTMRALVVGRRPEWVLAEKPVPTPGPGQVLVRNQAAAFNSADIPMLVESDPTGGGSGEEFVAGYEYTGEIAALGPDTGGWAVGDPVMGTFPWAFAEHLVADHRFVLPRPDRLAPQVACALATALLTEKGALAVAGFEEGKSVLITGASTSIGLIGVQIAKTLGADTVVVTENEDLTETALAATGGRGVDGVLDHVDGPTFRPMPSCHRHRRTRREHRSPGRPRLHDRPRRAVVSAPHRPRGLVRVLPGTGRPSPSSGD